MSKSSPHRPGASLDSSVHGTSCIRENGTGSGPPRAARRVKLGAKRKCLSPISTATGEPRFRTQHFRPLLLPPFFGFMTEFQ